MLAEAALILCTPILFQEEQEPVGRATAYRVDRVETLEDGPVLNATVIVRDGLIETIGQAVVIPEKAEVIDLRGSGATMMPPLVLSHANFLQRDTRSRGRNGKYLAVDSLWLGEDDLSDLLEQGILLLGVDPPGSGIPGRTSVLSTDAAHPRPAAVVHDLFLKLTIDNSSGAKDVLRKALKAADAAMEKEEKAKETWEQARKDWAEKQKKAAPENSKKKKKDEDGSGDDKNAADSDDDSGGDDKSEKKPEKEQGPPETFEPPKIDPNLMPVVEWLRVQRPVQIWIKDAADWLHWEDVLGDRELSFEAVLSHGTSQNLFEVAEGITDRSRRVYLPARITYLPNTRIRANLPADLDRAGAELVLMPPSNSALGVKSWRQGVADVVRDGLDRETALRAISLGPAAAMGQEETIQSLKPGAPATFIIFQGDALDPTAKVEYVLREGKVLYDRSKEEEK